MWWSMAAWAGSVFINNVHVEPSQLAGMTFENASVRMDAQGNVHIIAPGYTVRPATPSTDPVTPALAQPVPAPVMPAPVMPMPGPTAGTAPTTPVPNVGQVPGGRYWLYIHDKQSTGHSVAVFVNGTEVKRAASGQVAIIDIGRWLRPGPNAIRIDALSDLPTGGPMYVYIGQGRDNNGTVDLGTPDIQFSVGRSKQGRTTEEFTLQVTP